MHFSSNNYADFAGRRRVPRPPRTDGWQAHRLFGTDERLGGARSAQTLRADAARGQVR